VRREGEQPDGEKLNVEVKIGMDLRLWANAPGVEALPLLETLAAQGYDGAEVPLAGQSDSSLKVLAIALRDQGLQVTTSTRLPVTANPISPDAGERQAAVDYLRQRVDDSALLGSRLLCGGFFQAHGVFSGEPPSDREWEWSRRCLSEVAEHASRVGITLALEFQSRFDAYLINSAAAAGRMCRDVGADNMGVAYNTFHAHLEEPNPARALPSAGDRLLHVRLAESHRGVLGLGQVQFAETFATLDFLDYDGWLVVEALAVGVGPAHPENVWRNDFESAEQLSADAITLVQGALRAQRH
jgi:D-psicose/D-tagatose/L-ribulose 3-epimerase